MSSGRERAAPRAAQPGATTTGSGRGSRRTGRAGKRAGGRRGRSVPSEEATVAEKLAALKKLMPSAEIIAEGTGPAVGAGGGVDRLLDEAAGYIISLKARVSFLQRLLQVNGCCVEEELQFHADLRKTQGAGNFYFSLPSNK